MDLAASGEHFQRLFVLTADHGVMLCMLRVGRRYTGERPDLFDDAALQLERKAGGGWFVREYQRLCGRRELAGNYATLRQACFFARLLKINYSSTGNHTKVLELGRKILDQLGNCNQPELVLLKGVYLLARAEGYPVEQQWLAGQNQMAQSDISAMLRLPLDQQKADAETVARALDSLLSYLRHHTEIHVPDSVG